MSVATEQYRNLRFAPVSVGFDAGGPIDTDFVCDLGRRLDTAAAEGQRVTWFIQAGKEMTPDSLAALNSYLRTFQIGRCGLPGGTPWHRIGWREFVAHLGLSFE